jgi:hypothetical protein
MSWVNDLASSLGIPAGAATLAMAMYAACAAAEKAARPDALEGIGRVLRDSSWSRSTRAPLIVERVFVWTFGDRHISWKCILRSIAATTVFCCALLLMFTSLEIMSLEVFQRLFERNLSYAIMDVVLVGVISDYVALAKTRALIRFSTSHTVAVWKTLGLILVDIIGSFCISALMWTSYNAFTGGVGVSPDPDQRIQFRGIASLNFTLYSSTLLTSIWLVLMSISTVVLKLIAPLQRITSWFFDVDKHPVQAIGIVAGALVMIGAGFWSLLRWLI